MNNIYYKILNEIASAFDMDQWDEQVNPFTEVIESQLNGFIHYTEDIDYIYILENHSNHDFPQFNFYKKRCYVNGEKVKLDIWGTTYNKWENQKTVNVIIEDLNQLGESCKSMFYRCFSLISVPKFDTRGVWNMRSMFSRCVSLKSVPKFDTSGVTDMGDMFFLCNSLSEKTIEEWSSVYDFKTDGMK